LLTSSTINPPSLTHPSASSVSLVFPPTSTHSLVRTRFPQTSLSQPYRQPAPIHET
jgi:hypothetical protein